MCYRRDRETRRGSVPQPASPGRAAAPEDSQDTSNPFWVDVQTGEVYRLKHEDDRDRQWAIASIAYLLLMMAFFFWLTFDFAVGGYRLAKLLAYHETARLGGPAFRVFAAAFVGGALGGIVDGLRSAVGWHSSDCFGRAHVWKYLFAPWRGATLAFFAIAVIRSGISAAAGGDALKSSDLSQWLTAFGVGVLAGYGSHNFMEWLDAQVTRVFKVERRSPIVPLVVGRTKREAEFILPAARLKVGKVDIPPELRHEDPEELTVTAQSPAAGLEHVAGGGVSITLGRRPRAADVAPADGG